MSSEEKKEPIRKFRAKTVSAAVWENQVEVDGERKTRFSVSIDKRYLDAATNTWQSSSSFFADDLLRLQFVAGKAYDFILQKEEGDGK